MKRNGVLHWRMTALLISALVPFAADGQTLVNTTFGKLQGAIEAPAVVFRGIPYAVAPVGELRWRAPREPHHWSGVRMAREYGASCPQVLDAPTQLSPLNETSEDCLFLNVWVPREAGKKLPVVVWIHGGGFIAGSGSEREYDGTYLAAHGVIVVTINYRIGRLGFFAHPALERQHTDEPHGNFGLMDQIAALRWVRDNILQFRGDPKNVTVAGESAGGISIMALLTSSQAAGLFAKAIIQSGVVHRRMRSLAQNQDGLPSAESIGAEWAQSVGITGNGPEVVAALRRLPVDRIAPASVSPELLQILQSGGPMLDGKVLSEPPDAAITDGRERRVPILIGCNDLEALVWSFDRAAGASTIPITALDAEHIFQGLDQGQKQSIVEAYGGDVGSLKREVALAIASDRMLGAPTFYVARTLSGRTPIFLYRFSAVPTPLRSVSGQPPHGTEVFYVFGTLNRLPFEPDRVSGEDRNLSASIMKYWTEFARTGEPAVRGQPSWSRLSSRDPKLMRFTSTGVSMQAVPHESALMSLLQGDRVTSVPIVH